MTNDNALMGEPLSEADRLAEIRRTLKMAKMASTNAPGTFWHTFTENTEFLLELVGVLEGQLATAEDRVLIEQGEVIKREKAVKNLERALDEQRWYGEQLQSSVDACSGNHLPVEAYEG